MTVQLLDGPRAGLLTDTIGADLVIEVDGDLYYRADVLEQTSHYRHVGPRPTVVDLFAGPGGWDLAARELDLEPLGIEFDEQTCATRRAAGLWTLQGDVSALDPGAFAGVIDGLIASPPCQAWSNAGKRLGIIDKPHVLACARELAAGRDTRAAHAALCEDARSMLVVEPLRWALELRPRWITLEQVPPVLELWDVFADLLRDVGYSVWTGKLEAERYGVPQTRERAILIARLDGPAEPPPPTHQRYVKDEPAREEATLEGTILRWVSMAEALGWAATDRVGFPRLNDRDDGGEYRDRDLRPAGLPAFGLTEKVRSWTRHPGDGATVRTGVNSMSSSRDLDEMTPYERSVDAPSPTVDTATPRRWKIGFHGEGLPWRERRYFRASNQEKATSRSIDEPAPTLLFANALNEVVWTDEPNVPPSREGDASRERVPADHPQLLEDESPVDEASPVDRAEPSHLNTGRDWKPGGSREDAQTVGTDQPAPTIDGDAARMQWVHDRPATTLAGDPRVFPPGAHDSANHRGQTTGRSEGAIRVTEAEALVLQTFPPDYPLQGNATKRYEQVGNAVPPLLALPILRAAGAVANAGEGDA